MEGPYSGGGLFSLLPPAEGLPCELQLERMASGTPTDEEEATGADGADDRGGGGGGMSRCSSGEMQCVPPPSAPPPPPAMPVMPGSCACGRGHSNRQWARCPWYFSGTESGLS